MGHVADPEDDHQGHESPNLAQPSAHSNYQGFKSSPDR